MLRVNHIRSFLVLMAIMIKSKLKILCLILSASWVTATISGINYMDPLIQKPLYPLPGEDPCHPLYWYPRHIPDYCYTKVDIKPPKVKPTPETPPAPMPSPPMPMPPPMPFPIPIPFPMYPMFPSAVPQFVQPPAPYLPPPPPPQQFLPAPAPFVPPPAPFPLPVPQSMIPAPYGVPPTPYSYPISQQAGLVPGIPGLVSEDGGINILPFSDAYSDMLEKHKQKTIRKRLQKILDDYEGFPRKRKHRKYRGRYWT